MQSSPHEVIYGEWLHLECSQGAAQVKWFFKKNRAKNGVRYIGNKHIYEVKNIDWSYSGFYYCYGSSTKDGFSFLDEIYVVVRT